MKLMTLLWCDRCKKISYLILVGTRYSVRNLNNCKIQRFALTCCHVLMFVTCYRIFKTNGFFDKEILIFEISLAFNKI